MDWRDVLGVQPGNAKRAARYKYKKMMMTTHPDQILLKFKRAPTPAEIQRAHAVQQAGENLDAHYESHDVAGHTAATHATTHAAAAGHKNAPRRPSTPPPAQQRRQTPAPRQAARQTPAPTRQTPAPTRQTPAPTRQAPAFQGTSTYYTRSRDSPPEMRRYYAAQMQTQREKFAREIAARAHALQGSSRAHARTDRLKKAHLAKKLHRVIDRRAKMKASPYRPVELPGHRMEQ